MLFRSEFNHPTVSVFFNLTLKAMEQAVEVVGVLFDPECPTAHERRRRLRQAIADAHLPRMQTRKPPRLAAPRKGPRPAGRP